MTQIVGLSLDLLDVPTKEISYLDLQPVSRSFLFKKKAPNVISSQEWLLCEPTNEVGQQIPGFYSPHKRVSV